MNNLFDELVAISGLPGLYKMVANRPNGLIVEAIEDSKRRFCSVRKHQFSPLGSISIYTVVDAVPLKEVFQKMKEHSEDIPLPDDQSDKETLNAYLSEILPQYDRDRVYDSDIKKLVKWYKFLDEKNLLAAALRDEVNEEEE